MGLELVQIQPSIPRLPRPDWLRVRLPGGENYYELRINARAWPAYGVRERAVPEHWRVLGASHGHLHDFGRPVHAPLRLLRGTERVASWESGLGRAGACSPGGAGDGAEVCGGHLRGPR